MALDYKKREGTLEYINKELDRGVSPNMILSTLLEAKYPFKFISKTINYLPEKKFSIMHNAIMDHKKNYSEQDIK